MSTPRRLPVAAPAARVATRHKPWTVLSAANPALREGPRQVPLTRRYEVAWIDDEGRFDSFVRVAPAIPVFEQAFSAFAHGAVFTTTEGPVPVEDLVPGMALETSTGAVATLRWVGAITLVPNRRSDHGRPGRLYRVTADCFGFGRPSVDVTLGPAARLLNREASIRNLLGSEAALAPVESFADGVGVAEIAPVSPVRVYHVAFDGHHVLRVGGLEVESYHPGPDAHYSMSRELREVFLSLFPHVATMQGFGRLLWPRFETREDGNVELV